MGSKAFPQALISIPRTTPFRVGSNFSTLFPYRFNSTPITLSRVSSIASFLPRNTNRSLVLVRAEATPQSDEAPTPEDTVAETEDAEEVEEAEPQPSTPYKPRVKLGDIMGILNKRAIEAQDKLRPTPDLRTGDIVEIKFEVPENRRRSSIYKGIVISKQNAGIHTTIRIRRIVAGVGVEIVFPVYSPNIKEIKVIKHRKVRRARLYYLRDKLPRFSTFK